VKLLNQLEDVSFWWIKGELAGKVIVNFVILLVVTLQHSFSEVIRSCPIVWGPKKAPAGPPFFLLEKKFFKNFGRFREFKGRTQLLKGLFIATWNKSPTFKTGQITAQLSQVPDWLFIKAAALIKPAAGGCASHWTWARFTTTSRGDKSLLIPLLRPIHAETCWRKKLMWNNKARAKFAEDKQD